MLFQTLRLYNQHSSQIFEWLELAVIFSWQVVQFWVQTESELENVKISTSIYFLLLISYISTVFFPSLFCLSVNISWKVTLPDNFIQVRECVRPWPADGHTCCTSIFRMCHSILPVEFQLPFSLWSNWQSQVCAGMKKRKGRQFLANITHNWIVFFLHSLWPKAAE